MSTENIFEEDDQLPNEEVKSPTPQEALPPELAELVGDGKKYATLQEALKSIPHAQSHIQKLEADAITLREQAQRAVAMEELLEELRKQGSNIPDVQPQADTKKDEPVDISKMVEQVLAQKEAQRLAADNAKAVASAFKTTFGEDGEARFKQVAEESGLTFSELSRLSATSPNAVLKLAGIGKIQAAPQKTHSTTNTVVLSQGDQGASAKVKLVGATTKDIVAAWKNAGITAERKRNS